MQMQKKEQEEKIMETKRKNKGKRRFELFLCCLGNGITVCNKAVTEHGDYKMVAHIRDCGKIKWYVNPDTYVPGPDRETVERQAAGQKAKWEEWFSSMTQPQQYAYLMDHVPYRAFMEIVHGEGKENSLDWKVRKLKDAYFEAA